MPGRAAFFLLFLLVAGCAAPAARTDASGQAWLAAYAPKPIRLFLLDLEQTVQGTFPDDARVARLSLPGYSFDAATNTLTSEDPRSLWLIQANDTVVLLNTRLTSNAHAVTLQQVAIAPNGRSAAAHLGGTDFRVVVRGPALGSLYFGPYSIATLSLDLPASPPIPRNATWQREAAFPLLGASGIQYAERNVTFSLRATHVAATYAVQPAYLQKLRAAPAALDKAMQDWPSDFVPGLRQGMVTSVCGGLLLHSYDPCMDLGIIYR
ncbi:MAG TPA: hypothetical protein VM241_08940 [Candidatus Thermoplasmatota archaeon]|nr:hypothetical protein [Candidatus Thermoplasmatota archaeon]